MTIRSYDINLDSFNATIPEPIVGRQGDKNGAVTLHVSITDRGDAVDLTGQTVNLIAETAQGTAVVADNAGVTLTDATKGKFDYAIPNALWSESGKITKAYFSLNDTDGQQTTYDLIFIVKKSIDISKDKAEDYITIIGDLSAHVANTETSLNALETKIKQDGLFTQAEADALEQQLQAKWHDIEVIDYKPTRDGNTHMLSESYATIDDAKKDYPAATSLADTKDWCAITEAIQEGQKQGKNIYLAPGSYFVNKTIILPTGVNFYGAYQNSKIYASQQMSDDSKKQPLAVLEYDGEGQPPIYIENIQVLGSSDYGNKLIGLHLGGNRASKISNFIVSYCFGSGVLIYPTHPQSADVENTTFEHYWQVQSGSFCIKSNASINHGNITDFAVYDSQITTLDIHDENQSNTSSPAVEIINDDNANTVKSVYGIEFTRCFLHAQGNNLVRVVGCNSPSATHSINFDFIKGELHDVHGELGPGSDKFFLFHLENCWHFMLDHSPQLAYSGASYVEIKRCAFCDIKTAGIVNLALQHSDSMIFTLDKYSYENHINLIGMDVYLAPGTDETINNPDFGHGFGQANDAMDLFSKMKDDGSNNHITGWQIGQTLTLNNEPQRLRNITNGKINGLDDVWQTGVTSSTISNSVHTKHVLASGTQNIQLALPIPYKRISGFLFSFRAIGAPEDLGKLKLMAGSQLVQMPTDQNWHVWTGICQTNILQSIGFQASNNAVLSNNVTIEIEYMHCFMENKIPYYPDFVALPMPIQGEGNY